MRTWSGTLLALALGCGGGQSTDGNGVDPAQQPATEAQCTEMANHMLDVQIAARPEADRPAPEQEAEIRDNIRADFVPACVKEVLQPTYECWMAAETVEAFETCAGVDPAPPPEGAGPGQEPAPADPPPGDSPP